MTRILELTGLSISLISLMISLFIFTYFRLINSTRFSLSSPNIIIIKKERERERANIALTTTITTFFLVLSFSFLLTGFLLGCQLWFWPNKTRSFAPVRPVGKQKESTKSPNSHSQRTCVQQLGSRSLSAWCSTWIRPSLNQNKWLASLTGERSTIPLLISSILTLATSTKQYFQKLNFYYYQILFDSILVGKMKRTHDTNWIMNNLSQSSR